MQVRKEEKRDKREEKEKTEIKIIETERLEIERLEIDKRLNMPLLFSSLPKRNCLFHKHAPMLNTLMRRTEPH
jgi:hypothetical protein